MLFLAFQTVSLKRYSSHFCLQSYQRFQLRLQMQVECLLRLLSSVLLLRYSWRHSQKVNQVKRLLKLFLLTTFQNLISSLPSISPPHKLIPIMGPNHQMPTKMATISAPIPPSNCLEIQITTREIAILVRNGRS
ncbi:133aa long hypothetical protein [Pyrococcus horikoshii OT3]|uniref:Uncharacterized protein n=1 Tax=Pyrococcus horikoshii (strain ATCC 700860 / DSM 12428 / JCM 9974 / NBRC 100139 / OT-3) TaxID=70601 RepID=O58901_PYRHO|nr:133aa long hypothetical protein [Pyrococcus horikoshii OT3]